MYRFLSLKMTRSQEKQTKNGKAVSPPPDNKESGDLSPEHRVHQWVHREPMVYE